MPKYRVHFNCNHDHVCALNAFLFYAHFIVTICQNLSNTIYLVPSGSSVGVSCSACGMQVTMASIEECCKPPQPLWQVMTDLASNTVHCGLDSLLCSEYLLPCLGAASSSCIRHCMHIVVHPPGHCLSRSQPSASPRQLAAEHDVCAECMPTLEIIMMINVIATGATLQASL